MISVIDYGMGNLGSVAKALAYLNQPAAVTSDPEEVAAADRLILPGVGAMAYAVEQLKKRGLDQAIKAYLQTGKPFLGICLGMQLMFEYSEEGNNRGLGLLPGVVRRFPAQPGLKVPHMGWNSLQDSRLDILPNHEYFYFVHSYYVDPADSGLTAAWSVHGIPFAAAVADRQILLTQFHPEKSGDAGLRLLERWASGGEARV
ncbi:MAG: imidazole glycerol phosphate synthase subunit HisH [Clostridiaceae bacterium]|nr:imidazole glycerol phosphate synthase subunit HisH [Clostridiaceae bacterium]